MNIPNPQVNSLHNVYDSAVISTQEQRYKSIVNAFKSHYDGMTPDFFARSPGRVNIIGEHIDYCGYSVLPMAIGRDVVIAVAARDAAQPSVRLANIKPEKYPDNSFEHSVTSNVEIDSSIHAWSNYFKCGYKGGFDVIQEDSKAGSLSTSLQSGKELFMLMDGNVPAGAGVSSSSAFVCASALATITSYNHAISKERLTETAIRSERYAGVQTGGMDQSISIMGTADSALLIHFYPKLSAEPIKFPSQTPPYVFVIANTLVTADKHTTAPTNYNLRVVETRLAAALLAKRTLKSPPPVNKILTLREYQDLWAAENPAKVVDPADMPAVLAHLLTLVEAEFKDAKYSKEEVAAELVISVAELESIFIGSIVIRCDGFELKKRARHVFSEARRVFQFRDVCALRPPYSGEVLKDLGNLMNESQKSCKEDFNCSCPEIDELTTIARSAGAVGSRLTGAGWGGCTVSLVPEPLLAGFMEKVVEEYYYKRQPSLINDPNKDALISDWIFASKPSTGAAVLRLGDF